LKEEITGKHNINEHYGLLGFGDFAPCVLLERHDVSDETTAYTFTAEYEATLG
jgi:hypothetical protein